MKTKKSITTKKKRLNKLPIIVVLAIIFVIAIGTIWLKPSFISKIIDTNSYDYVLKYDGMYGDSYYIRIDTKTKALLVEERQSCNAVDCNASTNKYGPTILTNEEYTKIFSTIKASKGGDDMEYIASMLESMARDQEPFDGHLTGNATTQREFANEWLDDIIKETP